MQTNSRNDNSINPKFLKDAELLERTQFLATEERRVSVEVLRHLAEVERRRLYANCGYPSLFEYCLKELKYSESAAQRRISSMRLLKEVPEMEEKIESGEISMSVLSQAQTFFRAEAKAEKPLDVEEKKEVLSVLQNKSSREAEKELLSRSSEPATLQPERIRPLTAEYSEIKIVVDEGLLQNIEKLKGLLSHAHPNMTLAEMMKLLVDLGLKKYDPAAEKRSRASGVAAEGSAIRPAITPGNLNASMATPTAGSAASPAKSPTSTSTPTPTLPPEHSTSAVNSSKVREAIPTATKRAVWQRDDGRCQYPKTGEICGSRHFLQVYHIQPVALGGSNEPENLRLLCATHNQMRARETFGERRV